MIDVCTYFHNLATQHMFLTTFSLAYRIVRICSKPELRDAQFSKQRDFLLSRDYNSSIVGFAVVRAKEVAREVALKKVEKKEKPDRVIFSISFNPLLHHTETLDSHGPGSLNEGGFSKSTYGNLKETS